MPTVRYTADDGTYTVAGTRFTPGDTAEVSLGLATHLIDEVGEFERVNDAGDDKVHEEDGPPDGDEWEDWSENAWLELDYQQRADDVRDGRVDEHLDAIADVETSETVADAVDHRRDELEE